VARNGGPADGHRIGDLLHRLVTVAEETEDFASIVVTQSLKGIPWDGYAYHSPQPFGSTRRFAPPEPVTITLP
jgi:hypothetical protein